MSEEVWEVREGQAGSMCDIILEYSPGERETWIECRHLSLYQRHIFTSLPLSSLLLFHLSSDYPSAPAFFIFSLTDYRGVLST